MKNIAAKMVKIMADCAYVSKNAINSFHNYRYVTAADVIEKINAAMVKYNVASAVNAEIISMNDSVSQSGKTERLATVRTTVTLIDCDSSETLTIVGLGSGADVGDKSLAKALTSSLKYCYLMSFAIATGYEDSEADADTDRRNNPPPAPISKPHVQDEGDIVCSDCGSQLTKGVLKVSVSKYGRPLCMVCQRKHAA